MYLTVIHKHIIGPQVGFYHGNLKCCLEVSMCSMTMLNQMDFGLMPYSFLTSASQFQILEGDMVHRKETHGSTILRGHIGNGGTIC